MSTCRCGADHYPRCGDSLRLGPDAAHVPVTTEELAEIARLDRDATHGPWNYSADDYIIETEHGASIAIMCVASRPGLTVVQADGRLIATYRTAVPRLARDLTERTAERDAMTAERDKLAILCEHVQKDLDERTVTVERLIREAGAIRLDERQRAKAEHDSLADEGRARCERRCEELEDTIARMRRIIDDADRVKDENETLRRDLAATRAELKALHDVLSGKRPLTK